MVTTVNLGSIDDIRQSGFHGFLPISALQISKCCEVPNEPGVYLILRANSTRPEFLVESVGGHFKKRQPTVLVDRLQEKWVEDALILNIGKAGPGKATLKIRLKQYLRFGQGQKVGHRGGRYIWQLTNSSNLLGCWRTTGDAVPRTVEKALIEEFRAVYGKLPFANLNH
jgi:hypothetical protein